MKTFAFHTQLAPSKLSVTRLLFALWALLCLGALVPARAQNYSTSIETRGTHLFVAVKINGKPATFGLDTGASTSIITPQAVERLGLKTFDATNNLTIDNFGGEVKDIPQLRIPSLEVAGFTYINIPAMVYDFSSMIALGSSQWDGVLGAEFFQSQITTVACSKAMLPAFRA